MTISTPPGMPGHKGKGEGSPHSINERWVPELIPVLAVSLQVT